MKRSPSPLYVLAAGLGLAAGLAPWSAPVRAQEEDQPCAGVLASPEQLAGVLGQVPKYTSTYVLVYPERLADKITAIDAPAVKELHVATYDGTPAVDIAAQLSPLPTEPYPFRPADAASIVSDVLAGKIDAAVVWAPLAGLAVLDLDFNYELSLLTASEPRPAPANFATGTPEESGAACAAAIGGLLESYGVVPAEKLVHLNIRDFLLLEPPPRNVEVARSGAALFADNCAKCHGADALAAPGALAPVDLLVSVRRFSFPGFLYIALNGRPQNGMPGFRGTLSKEQLELIYQFVRERSHGEIPPAAQAGAE